MFDEASNMENALMQQHSHISLDLTKDQTKGWSDAGGCQGGGRHQSCSSRHDGHTRHWEQGGIMKYHTQYTVILYLLGSYFYKVGMVITF